MASNKLDLYGINTLLVKFYFTNPVHIPPGIPQKGVRNARTFEFRHLQWAVDHQMYDVTEIGRHRKGRIDTGEQVVSNLPGTRASFLGGTDLSEAGFVLSDIHWFMQSPKKDGDKVKYVVCMTFSHGDALDALPDDVVEAVNKLATDAVWYAHVWDNPNNVATINFVGRQQGGKAQNHLFLFPGIGTNRAGALVAHPETEEVASRTMATAK